jgi:hypothetical protein
MNAVSIHSMRTLRCRAEERGENTKVLIKGGPAVQNNLQLKHTLTRAALSNDIGKHFSTLFGNWGQRAKGQDLLACYIGGKSIPVNSIMTSLCSLTIAIT